MSELSELGELSGTVGGVTLAHWRSTLQCVSEKRAALLRLPWVSPSFPDFLYPAFLCTATGMPNEGPYVKDAFHRAVVSGETAAVNPEAVGTKCARDIVVTVKPGQTAEVWTRFVVESTIGATVASQADAAAAAEMADQHVYLPPRDLKECAWSGVVWTFPCGCVRMPGRHPDDRDSVVAWFRRC